MVRGWGRWEALCTPRGQSGLSICGFLSGWQVRSRRLDGVQDLGAVCRWDLGVGVRVVRGLSCGTSSAQQGGILSFTRTARIWFSASEIIGGACEKVRTIRCFKKSERQVHLSALNV